VVVGLGRTIGNTCLSHISASIGSRLKVSAAKE
jgi:hypothetical protein